MPTPVTTVEEYAAILKRSKLIPEADVDVLHSRFSREPEHGKGVTGFRQFLVAQHMLTEYQAALLQRGRAEGFFLGGYVILDRIGKGASGSVYKAVHSSGKVVAIKVLPNSKSKQGNDIVLRFQREGRLLTQLDHPNVVRAFQIKQSGTLHYIVMEFLEGITLADWLTKYQKMSVSDAVRLTVQILNGMQHLHEHRMIHRDLKPGNIMLVWPTNAGSRSSTKDATAKILDIGIGREHIDVNSSATQDIALTQEGALLGTPDYLAPEQARDARSVTIRADIYSAGFVFYHLIAGRPPFVEKSVMEMMMKHTSESPDPLSDVAQNVPNGLQTIFDTMTSKSPHDRYAEPKDAVEALSRFQPSDAPPIAQALPFPTPAKAWHEPEPARPAVAQAQPIPAPAAYPTPTATPLPPQPMPEINVELVTDEPASNREVSDDRTLLELNRRDTIMLATGSMGFLLAVGMGFALAMLLRTLL